MVGHSLFRMNPNPLRLACALVMGAACLQAQPTVLKLWPGAAPGDVAIAGVEHDTTTAKDNLIAGLPVIRTGNVSEPTIAIYRPAPEKNTGAAVVVCPGGGYYILAMDLEGTEVCAWLNSIGVTGVLLKYRVPAPKEPHTLTFPPLQDAQRALGLVRSHAREWGIDPARVGVLGFSAGGNLAALLSANSSTRGYPRVDGADDLSCKPDFQVLVYPGGLVDQGRAVSPSLAVTHATPPTFLVFALDDPVVSSDHAFGYATALMEAKVPLELHAYPTGGHGYGLRPTKDLVTSWPRRAEDWMRSRAILGRD